jgi:hypothetical protein
MDKIKNDEYGPKEKLDSLIIMLKDREYKITLVMDCFEKFTTSEKVTMTHHEALRALMENYGMSMVVATDADLNEDTLPDDVKGSFLLQKFSNVIYMVPFSEETSIRFIEKRQEEVSDNLIDGNVAKALHVLSGGVPYILEVAACCAYENIQENGQLESVTAKEEIYSKSEPYLKNWCKYLTKAQFEVLEKLVENVEKEGKLVHHDFTGEQSNVTSAVADLKKRGILVKYKQRKNGNIIVKDNVVCFNSVLLQKYFINNKDDIKNRFADIQNLPVTVEDTNKPAANITYNNVTNVYIENMNQVNQGIITDPGEFLKLIGEPEDDSSQNLVSYLHDQIINLKLPHLTEESTKAEITEYQEAISKVVPDVEVDEEGHITGVPEERLKNLDTMFEEVRGIRPQVTDEFLERQSERSQYYIKYAIVAENNNVGLANVIGEYSLMVFTYGKVLEQSLRDNMNDLILNNEQLNSQNITKDDIKKQMIGNYTKLLEGRNTKEFLAKLCVDCSMPLDTITEAAGDDAKKDKWREWWGDLRDDINKACEVRNKSSHAAENDNGIVNKNSLDNINELFGSNEKKGVLDRLLVAKKLYETQVNLARESRGTSTKIRLTKIDKNNKKIIIHGTLCNASSGITEVKVTPAASKTFFKGDKRDLLENLSIGDFLYVTLGPVKTTQTNCNPYFECNKIDNVDR